MGMIRVGVSVVGHWADGNYEGRLKLFEGRFYSSFIYFEAPGFVKSNHFRTLYRPRRDQGLSLKSVLSKITNDVARGCRSELWRGDSEAKVIAPLREVGGVIGDDVIDDHSSSILECFHETS